MCFKVKSSGNCDKEMRMVHVLKRRNTLELHSYELSV